MYSPTFVLLGSLNSLLGLGLSSLHRYSVNLNFILLFFEGVTFFAVSTQLSAKRCSQHQYQCIIPHPLMCKISFLVLVYNSLVRDRLYLFSFCVKAKYDAFPSYNQIRLNVKIISNCAISVSVKKPATPKVFFFFKCWSS